MWYPTDGATDKVAAPATEDESRAFEALQAIIRQAVLAEPAKQDEAVNQAASAAAEEAEETRQQATPPGRGAGEEKVATAEQATTIATLRAELAAAAEARGKLFVY